MDHDPCILKLPREVASYIAGLIDGEGTITKKRTTSDRHTPSFCYAITSQQALALLSQVTPFLLSYKRRRAELALAQYKALTPRNGKYTPELLIERREFEQSFLNLKSVRETPASYRFM